MCLLCRLIAGRFVTCIYPLLSADRAHRIELHCIVAVASRCALHALPVSADTTLAVARFARLGRLAGAGTTAMATTTATHFYTYNAHEIELNGGRGG